MSKEKPLRVHAKPESGDARGRTKDEEGVMKRPRRGEVLREFLVRLKEDHFEQYPYIESAYANTQTALESLGCNPGEIEEMFDTALEVSEDKEFSHTTGQVGRLVQYLVVEKVIDKLGELKSEDKIKLNILIDAMGTLHRRVLEMLAVFQKQEREHLASHRAHSSKIDGQFTFGGPELSFEAMKGALESGVKMIELDVHALADGTPVLSHGSALSSRVSKHANLEAALAAGETIDKTGAPLYSLDELFAEFEKYTGLSKLTIEIKSPEVVQGVIEAIRAHGLEKGVMVSAYNPQALMDIHRALPETALVFNTFVTELNAPTILDENPSKSEPTMLPLGIAVGGTELPEGEDKTLLSSHYRTIPLEVRELLASTGGYLCVNLWSAKFGFNKELLEKVGNQAKKEGFGLLMYRVKPSQTAFLKSDVDLLHLDAGEKIVYERTRTPRGKTAQ